MKIYLNGLIETVILFTGKLVSRSSDKSRERSAMLKRNFNELLNVKPEKADQSENDAAEVGMCQFSLSNSKQIVAFCSIHVLLI